MLGKLIKTKQQKQQLQINHINRRRSEFHYSAEKHVAYSFFPLFQDFSCNDIRVAKFVKGVRYHVLSPRFHPL